MDNSEPSPPKDAEDTKTQLHFFKKFKPSLGNLGFFLVTLLSSSAASPTWITIQFLAGFVLVGLPCWVLDDLCVNENEPPCTNGIARVQYLLNMLPERRTKKTANKPQYQKVEMSNLLVSLADNEFSSSKMQKCCKLRNCDLARECSEMTRDKWWGEQAAFLMS
ncbi:hypothetical protein GBA52_028147 [Prunus armeniaca]|nr:hypothetical protein GBA52_028147 [Prunus armeniaca]